MEFKRVEGQHSWIAKKEKLTYLAFAREEGLRIAVIYPNNRYASIIYKNNELDMIFSNPEIADFGNRMQLRGFINTTLENTIFNPEFVRSLPREIKDYLPNKTIDYLKLAHRKSVN